MDAFKAHTALSREWSRKERKADKASARAHLKQQARKEPTEPEVHPAEVHLIEHDAGICPLGCHDEGESP